jgi:hypothetical protein
VRQCSLDFHPRHGLSQDALPQPRFHSVLHDEIDGAAEQLLEPLLDAGIVEQPDGFVELDQQVHGWATWLLLGPLVSSAPPKASTLRRI